MSLETPDKMRSSSEKALLQGEGGARLPLLHPLRQDLPPGHSRPRLCACPRQRGRAGSGRDDLRADRGVGGGGVAGGPARGPCLEAVPARSGAAGDDPEAGGRRTSARHPDDSGSGGPNRRQPPGLTRGRSSRRTSRTALIAIGRGAARSTPSRKRTGCFAGAIPTLSTPICRNTWMLLHNAPWFMRFDRRVRVAGLSL